MYNLANHAIVQIRLYDHEERHVCVHVCVYALRCMHSLY